VKGYRLWYPDPKSPKFVISRDVIFDENFTLQSRKEFVVDSRGSGEEVSKQVELESKESEEVQESTHVERVDDAQGSTSGELYSITTGEQLYSITTGRARRHIRPPKQYAYADMIAYALSVAESIEIHEPSTYNEAISSGEAAERIVVITEEMESLHKNQT